MKKMVLFVAFLSLFLLTSCGLSKNSANEQAKIEQEKRVNTIKKNRKAWNKRVKAATNVDMPGDEYLVRVPDGYNDEQMSLKRLENGNQDVVKASVINLQPEFGRLFTVETKATIYIEKVISGDKMLQKKNIKTEFSGGLTRAGEYFTNFEGQYDGAQFGFNDKKTIVESNNPTIPMPEIGDHIIVGISKYQPDNKYQKADRKKHGLTIDNFYPINNPEVTFWIKKKGKYRLNNPAFYKKENRGKNPQIFKLTKQLNQKY